MLEFGIVGCSLRMNFLVRLVSLCLQQADNIVYLIVAMGEEEVVVSYFF